MIPRQELGSRIRGNDEKGVEALGGWYETVAFRCLVVRSLLIGDGC